MSFVAKLQRAREVLEQQGRLSVRALRRELELDGDELDEVVDELVEIQRVATRDGRALVWREEPNEPSTTATAEPSLERDPRDYTPKHLADKILKSKSALEGERKQVTVLFADVKGSMELSQELDPETWHQILERFFEILTDGVHRFEGTVNQYTGDGIMALFGAPIAHEDHARRACYAALHLRDELLGYAETLRRESALRFSARIGLNSGEVVVGRIGDDLRMDYTAQGHCVGLAQRMEQLAEPGKPYLAAPTAALVEGYFEREDLGEFAVKGADRVQAFALKGIGAQRHPLDRARRRGLSGFVGRDAELATLETALAHAGSGEQPVLGIVGEAGVGKSRLVHEFVERARAAGFHVLVGHCASHGKNVPLLGYLEMLRSNFGISDRDRPAAARAKITQRFVSAYPELIEPHLPLICDFLGVPDPDRPVPAMTPEERQRQLLDWQRRVIQNPLREPLLTVMEDLHWADPGTEAMCAAITETRRTRQVFLTTNRPEYRPPWAPKSFFHQLPLEPLAEGPVDQLLAELLGPEIAQSAFAERLRDRCAGTPFFIEELIQSLAESGVLEGERGAYHLAKPIDQIPLPGTVQAVLAARIDRLPEREKQVLQTASVIGRVFPRDVLEVVTKDAEVVPALHALMDAELVYEESVYPELEYSFKHALVQDVAYGSQLKGRREELHRRVADALERHYVHQLDAKAALVAQHLEAGAELLAAAQWQARAARWMSASDLSASRTHWSRARALLEALPPAADRDACLIDCCYELLWILDRTGASLAECGSLYQAGRDLASRLGDRRSEASLEASYAWMNTTHRKWDVTRRHAEAAIALADAEKHLPAQLFARFALQRVLIWHGSLAECARLGEEASRLTDEDTGMTLELAGWNPYVGVLAFRALGYALSGEPVKGSALFRKVIDNLGPGLRMNMSGIIGDDVWTCWVLGDGELALRRAGEGLRLAESFGAAFNLVLTLLTRGMASALVRRWDEARRFLEQGRALMRDTGAGAEYESAYDGYTALCLAALGERHDALDTAQRATRTAAGDGPYLMSVVTGCLRARVLRMAGGVERAAELEAQIADTLESIARAEMESWRPLILLERAGLNQLIGDADGVARDLGEASELFRRMGVTGWDDYARSIASDEALRSVEA